MPRAPQLADVSPQEGNAPFVAERPKTLQDDHRTGARVFLQQAGDGRLERIDLAGSRTASWSLNRRVQVLPQGFTCQVQVAGDLAHGPMFTVVQPVNFVKAVG